MRRAPPRYVFDATPLIYLAKTSLLEATLSSCEAYVTEAVVKETTLSTEYSDAIMIREAVERGLLRVYTPVDKTRVTALARHPEMHLGEAETLASAEELKAHAVIDDQEARAVAKLYHISTHPGTLFILLRLVATGRLTPSEAEKTLEQLTSAGLFLDPRTLVAAKRRIMEYTPK